LRVKILQIGHQVLHHRLMRQRIDLYRRARIVDRLRAGKRVGAVDIHGAGATYAFAA
jgi:hypothetical protein